MRQVLMLGCLIGLCLSIGSIGSVRMVASPSQEPLPDPQTKPFMLPRMKQHLQLYPEGVLNADWEGWVTAISRTTITMKVFHISCSSTNPGCSAWGTPDQPPRSFVLSEPLAAGGFPTHIASVSEFRRDDVQIGDIVALYTKTTFGRERVMEIDILRRPGGEVPPHHGPALSVRGRGTWHDMKNADQAFEERGVPLPKLYNRDGLNAALLCRRLSKIRGVLGDDEFGRLYPGGIPMPVLSDEELRRRYPGLHIPAP